MSSFQASWGMRWTSCSARCPQLSGLYTNDPWRHMQPGEFEGLVGLPKMGVQQLCRLAEKGLPQDPVYSFRKATQDRYLYDPLDRKFVHLNPTPFVLDDTQNAKLKGTPRHFGEVSAEVLTLPAVQRIYQTMAELTRQNMQLPALPAAASDEHRILVSCHIFMIYTEPGAESADFAEPTPEGVHQDGAEHVMVLLLGRENVEADSARSQIFSLKQDIGPSPGEDSPELLFASELKEPGEAIFMADRLVKHAVTPVRPADPCKPAWRMVMVAWSRRPTVGDRLALHESSPCPTFM